MAERASPFAAPVASERAGITLSQPPRGSLWQIAAWPDTYASVEASLAGACGCEAPAPGIAAAATDGRLLIRVEPLKWWVLGDDGATCPLRLEPDQGAWLDMSHDQATIAVTGSKSAEFLKRLVSIDLRAHGFPDLSFATTQAHHMITRVLRRDHAGTPRYEVMVMRSYANNLHEILGHNLNQFG